MIDALRLRDHKVEACHLDCHGLFNGGCRCTQNDPCFVKRGDGAVGIDHPEFFTIRAPRPAIILAAEKDFKDIRFTRKTFQEARAHLGVETQRQWSDLAILRTTPTLLGLFSWVSL